jgi:putative holliday junction resolvase
MSGTNLSIASPHMPDNRSRYTGCVTETLNGQQKPKRPCILGVDYGRSRVGLAIADAEARLAQPLGTLERINRNEDMRRLREMVREHGVKQIVVGLPLRLDGSQSEMAEEATRFAERLRKQIGVPVEMVDERLTSWEAERLLEETQGRILHKQAGGTGKKIRKDQGKITVDAMAAAVILKEYLDQQQSASASIQSSEGL